MGQALTCRCRAEARPAECPEASLLDTEATLEIQQLVAEFKPGNADLLRALHKVQPEACR